MRGLVAGDSEIRLIRLLNAEIESAEAFSFLKYVKNHENDKRKQVKKIKLNTIVLRASLIRTFDLWVYAASAHLFDCLNFFYLTLLKE